jgi:phosphomannomutase
VAFCQDPDADRLAILDGDGSYIGEEYTLALAARAVLEVGGGRGGGAAVLAANLSTSRMIDDVAAAYGGRVARTAVGEANVVAAMKRAGSPIGGEGNGGVIWPAVTYVRDSLGAMAVVLGLMAATGRTLRELVAEVPAYAIEKRKVEIASKEAARPAVEAVRRHFGRRAGARIDTQDGVRVDLRTGEGDAWVHVRASNTEPIMRLIAEAPSVAGAAALLDETAAAIRG